MTATEPVTDYVELPVHERPLVRELAEWRTFIPFTGRVLALQGSHETVAKGLYDHSTGFVDPLGRAARTMEYAQRMLFGSDRVSTAAEIRELHRDIKGTGFDGRPYHAWNREAWTWVHLTSFEAFAYSLRVVHGPVDPASLGAPYEDWRQVGMLYGVRSADMPTDVVGLHEYVRGLPPVPWAHAGTAGSGTAAWAAQALSRGGGELTAAAAAAGGHRGGGGEGLRGHVGGRHPAQSRCVPHHLLRDVQ